MVNRSDRDPPSLNVNPSFELLEEMRRGSAKSIRARRLRPAKQAGYKPAVLTHSKSPPQWLTELVKRRPKNVAVVAMANKMARTIWALSAHERAYQTGYVSRPA